jgi:hypothetical protein
VKDALTETDLVMPGLVAPSNLKRGGRFRSAQITSDIYNICTRLQELSPRLYLHWVEDTLHKDYDSKDQIAFVVTEITPDGTEAVVLKTRHLSPQIIEDVRYFMGVPLAQRAAEMIKKADKFEADAHESHMDRLYEEMGAPMLRQLYHDGFVDGAKPNPFHHSKRRKLVRA